MRNLTFLSFTTPKFCDFPCRGPSTNGKFAGSMATSIEGYPEGVVVSSLS